MARITAKTEGRDTRICARCGFKFSASKCMCPSCKNWHLTSGNVPVVPVTPEGDQTVMLEDEEGEEDLRYILKKPLSWANRVFGGGLVTNSVTLYGGKNGAGKSTLSLQLAVAIAEAADPQWPSTHVANAREVLYVAAEEKTLAIKARAKRLKLDFAGKIRVYPVGASTSLADIIMLRRPRAVFFDSLPAFISDPAEAVEFCGTLKEYACVLDCPMIVIDHITKDDDFAGLEALQHKVDTCVTQYPIEDSRDDEMREVNVTKNRFGPANWFMRVRMTESGIVYHESDQGDEDEDEDDGE